MPVQSQTLEYIEEEPLRLDVYLSRLWPSMSRQYIQQIIEQGAIEVNGKKAKKSTQLNRKDQISIASFTHSKERTIVPCQHQYTLVADYDDYMLVDKPAHLPTHPNQFNDQHSLANAIVYDHPQIMNVGEDPLRPGIVHRLDTDTSGLMLVAKTQKGFVALRKCFDERKIHKLYLALVLCDIQGEGKIDAPIAHHPKSIKKMVVVDQNTRFRSKAREAVTWYKVLHHCEQASLLLVKTLTGRMHQVRVHLQSKCWPLVGDKLYQSAKQKQMDRFGLDRHFLHAFELSFLCPIEQKPRCFRSRPHKDLMKVLNQLGFDDFDFQSKIQSQCLDWQDSSQGRD